MTDILRNFNVSGMSFDEVQGAGRMKRREIRERDGVSKQSPQIMKVGLGLSQSYLIL